MLKQNESQMRKVAAAAGFDADNFSMAYAVRALLTPLADAGTSMDSGGGADSADLWITVGGVEYFINIRKSRQQKA